MRANKIDLMQSPAIFVTEFNASVIEVDRKRMYLRNGRCLNFAEIGIALAHKRAQELLINSKQIWHIVLEDDAIIVDDTLLLSQISEIQKNKTKSPTIYLLYHNLVESTNSKTTDLFYKSKSIPSYAVAYVANKSAIELLVRAQNPIFSVSDWPICTHKADFFLASSAAIEHGSENGYFDSYVGSPVRNVSGTNKWKWIFGRHIICSGLSIVDSLHDHLCFVIFPRIRRFNFF
jgi:GR25 family glycosyltransferase involved in LPS biosynthesis